MASLSANVPVQSWGTQALWRSFVTDVWQQAGMLFFPKLASHKRVRGALLMLEWFYLGEITLAGAYPCLSVYILKLLGLCPKSTEISESLSIYSSEP